MATTTPNIGLTKPDLSELYDIGVQNTNMDLIDTSLGALYYKSGDTVSLNGGIYAGSLTNFSKDLYFFIPLPKLTDNVTVSSSSISGNWLVRAGTGGNIINNATLASAGTVTVTKVAGGIQVKVVLSTAASAATNQAISAYGYTGSQITFS